MRSILDAKTATTAPLPKIVQLTSEKETTLRALAMELGYSLTPVALVGKALAKAMAQRMCQRKGNDIMQTASYEFPRDGQLDLSVAESFLGPSFMSEGLPCWKAETVAAVSQLVGPLMALLGKSSGFSCAGASRGLKSASEAVIRVVATVMPALEITHQKTKRLKFEFQYILWDEAGELHPPKDEERREIGLSPQLEADMRQQVLADLLEMGRLGFPLSAGFWRRLDREDKALEVEALSRSRLVAKAQATAAGRKRAQRADLFEVEEIVAQRGKHYLVRWAGYHHTWEPWRVTGAVGDPVETWEKEATVRNTEAMVVWEGNVQA